MTPIRNSCLVTLLLGVAILVDAPGAHAQQSLPRIALKGGESVDLRNFFFIVNCQSVVIGTPQVEVLEGPDELILTFREEMILPRAYNCPRPVPGGIVVATAREVTEPKEAKLTFRLKFNSKLGERQNSNSYIVSLYPGAPSEGGFGGPSRSTIPTGPTQSTSPQ